MLTDLIAIGIDALIEAELPFPDSFGTAIRDKDGLYLVRRKHWPEENPEVPPMRFGHQNPLNFGYKPKKLTDVDYELDELFLFGDAGWVSRFADTLNMEPVEFYWFKLEVG